ncbi:MAG: transcriptional regulator, AsnC family [Pseudonocardiales bacterium]|nr:transcriptional regulator, AsnC family [Pseudonocardiales bacterium]
MSHSYPRESAAVGQLDQQIIRSMQLSPRAPFSLIARVLEVSEQTVARRYRRLRAEGLIRIVAVVDPRLLGESSWMVRVRCRPDGVGTIADALARRDDVGWVSITGGGSEVLCAVRSRTREQRDVLLSRQLPRTSAVLGMDAVILLHIFAADQNHWSVFAGSLSAEQADQLRAPTGSGSGGGPAAVDLTKADEPMLTMLQRDGRATTAALAAAAGMTEARVARRLSSLLASGALYLDVDLAAGPLGYTAQASLWLTAAPAHLAAVGETLGGLPDVAFAAATSGRSNLYASVLCRDTDHLYRFATREIAAIEGVQTMEISPIQRVVKQAGALTDGYRLIPPNPR